MEIYKRAVDKFMVLGRRSQIFKILADICVNLTEK